MTNSVTTAVIICKIHLAKSYTILGMHVFLLAIAFYGVSPDALLAISSDLKLKVKNEVQKGIELGIVKPFDSHILTGPCTGRQAIKALM